MKNNPCTHCGGTTHTSLMCFNKPRKPLVFRPATKGYTNMKAAYAHWHRENPPDENDLWYCHYCGQPLTIAPDKLNMGIQRLTLDHYQSRSRRVDLRYETKNLVPACFRCNSEKGSVDGDTYKNKRSII